MSLSPATIRLAVPKGRMQAGVTRLLEDAGVRLSATVRDYRPAVSLDGWETKILKPQNVVEMLHAGARDVGFAGADWVFELGADLVELADTGLDQVRIVAAAPEALLRNGALPSRPLVVASEYARLTGDWIAAQKLDARFLRVYGATEVFPPEDADCIVDNTATGATLAANGLVIVDTLMTSTTRLYASRRAMDDPGRRAEIERFQMLIESALEARKRAMIEINVSADDLDALIEVLPCMREPTVSPLHRRSGFAVKAAVPRADLATVIPAVKACGGTDIIVTSPEQIVR